MQDKSYALVIGSDHYNTLGVLRSLGEMNVRCIFVCVDASGQYVKSSKYISQYFPCSYNTLKKTILNILSDNKGTAVIIPTGDKIMLELSKIDFSRMSVICPKSSTAIDSLLEKSYVSRLAERCGLKVPHEVVIKPDGNYTWNSYPAIIKPLKSLQGKKSDITVCNNGDSFYRTLSSFFDKGYPEVLVQEFLADPQKRTIEIMGATLKDGTILLPTPIVKIREYPSNNGSTSYAYFEECIDEKDKSAISTLLQEIGFYGIFDIEFIEDHGTLYFIELNIRNGAPSYASTLAGLNLPYIWYQDAIGNDVHVKTHLDGKLMAEQLDYRHIRERAVSFVQWIKQYRECDYKIFINKKDFKPCLSYFSFLIKRRFKR